MTLLIDKIRAEAISLAPAGVEVCAAERGTGVLVASRGAGTCIEIQQTQWIPVSQWTLAEYRPAQAPILHVVECEWAILTTLQLIWRRRYATEPRSKT